MQHASDPHDDEVLYDPPGPAPVHYAERALLGALLLEPALLADLEQLEADAFSNASHGALFSAMRRVPVPGPVRHQARPFWVNAVLEAALPDARGLTVSYMHTLISVCPHAGHAPAYAAIIRAEHARRTIRLHSEHLARAAADTALPDRATAALARADALAQHLDELSGRFPAHPGSLPRTTVPPAPAGGTDKEDLDEERMLLAGAAVWPSAIKEMRWLTADDFLLSAHGALWQCLNALSHRGDPVDPVTVLWEAQHRGLLSSELAPDEVVTLMSASAGSPEHWGTRVIERALLSRAGEVARRIGAYTDDPSTTVHQLITGSHRALADLTALRTRWHRATTPQATTAPRAGVAVSARAGPRRPGTTAATVRSTSTRRTAGRTP
ncbi:MULTISPECIES: DnaB-like helicase N-terminal domain-containing protein [Streptomyces]|uniref:Replicative DNA helicase n=1 Tax=Streptomyces venezuelae TaxID=54571 RepID=A0A5P2AR24_STRVZ|nr:DnaB-like helicase N-terminal domain-containing protein [Streptomyces venezuelae]QES18719.1 replicative DNA helicase [Streptomyces venezuelae]